MSNPGSSSRASFRSLRMDSGANVLVLHGENKSPYMADLSCAPRGAESYIFPLPGKESLFHIFMSLTENVCAMSVLMFCRDTWNVPTSINNDQGQIGSTRYTQRQFVCASVWLKPWTHCHNDHGCLIYLILNSSVRTVNSDNWSRSLCVAARIFSFLESVQQFAAVIETFVSSNPGTAVLVWGSAKLALFKVPLPTDVNEDNVKGTVT